MPNQELKTAQTLGKILAYLNNLGEATLRMIHQFITGHDSKQPINAFDNLIEISLQRPYKIKLSVEYNPKKARDI